MAVGEGLTVAEQKQLNRPAKHDKKKSRAVLKRLLKAARPESGRISVALIGLLVSSGTNMAFPTIMGKLIDRTTGRATGMTSSVPDKVSRLLSKHCSQTLNAGI